MRFQRSNPSSIYDFRLTIDDFLVSAELKRIIMNVDIP